MNIREPVQEKKKKKHARKAKERTCTPATYFRGNLRGYKPRMVKSMYSCLMNTQVNSVLL